MSKNILIFRGNFNPIHKGQVDFIKTILELIDVGYKGLGSFDELWISPIYKAKKQSISHSLHQTAKLIDGIHRINIINLILSDFMVVTPKLKICTFELDTHNTAGIYKTLMSLSSYYPTYNFGVLMGSRRARFIRRLRYSRKFVRETRCVVGAMFGNFCIRNSEGIPMWFTKKPHIYLGKSNFTGSSAKRLIFSGEIRKFISNLYKKKEADIKISSNLTKTVQEYIMNNNLYRTVENVW